MNVIDRIKEVQGRNHKDYEFLAGLTDRTVAEVEADVCTPDRAKEMVHEIYCKAYETCQRARDQGKRYIGLQATKTGGFRLLAVKDSYAGTTCYRFDMLVPDWASNVVYRLVEGCFVPDLSPDDVNAYFDALHSTGYGGGREA